MRRKKPSDYLGAVGNIMKETKSWRVEQKVPPPRDCVLTAIHNICNQEETERKKTKKMAKSAKKRSMGPKTAVTLCVDHHNMFSFG